ncbi:MAG: pseudouridine synthase [Bacillota bacterium]
MNRGGVWEMVQERLQKVMAQAGVASRRTCEELILKGLVKVNGQVIQTLGTKVDPERDAIKVKGRLLQKPEPLVYLMLNKPCGYVTTMKDPQGRKTVTELLRGVRQRVYPVGRLDYHSEGLLLLTNDGELTLTLTHPRHHVLKTYLAQVIGIVEESALRALREGIELEDGKTQPARVKILKSKNGQSLLEIKISEGRNHQVRRMCDAAGHPVLQLKRKAIAFLELGDLPLGQYRQLTAEEVKRLKKLDSRVYNPVPTPH